MLLPEDFTQHTKAIMGDNLYRLFEQGLQEETPVSIRLNPSACLISGNGRQASAESAHTIVEQAHGKVPWCEEGYYLHERPLFTFDPLLHAGAYYVQEASSMFLSHVLHQIVHEPVLMLDLCAAPGGKSTCALSSLPDGSVLFSNEPMRNRAQILSENLQKWLLSDSTPPRIASIVTSNYASDYQRSSLLFDLILADVPCSGEGMFRKDDGAVSEWSSKNVEKCWHLQREIIEDIWPCLKPGGILVYSTCTFNTWENEQNVAWISEKLGADFVKIPVEECWNITGSLLEGFQQPVYRFIPGKTRGEGLFMAVLRKGGGASSVDSPQIRLTQFQKSQNRLAARGKGLHLLPNEFLATMREAADKPLVPLTWQQAITYLRREALVLPADTPKGIVRVGYHGLTLGLAKNLGNRANNLYPKEWRIKSTHIPMQQNIITI